MTIRSQNPQSMFIHYTDILSLRGVGESRAKGIFAEIAKANNLSPYEPRTMEHYKVWEKWKALKRAKRREERRNEKILIPDSI